MVFDPARPVPLPGRWQRAARLLLALLLGVISWLAFDPHPPPHLDTGWDKLNHGLAFSALAITAWAAFAVRRRAAAIAAALSAYGVLIELVQSMIPGRSGEWPDLLADGVGIGAGLLAARLAGPWLLRRLT